MKLLYMCPVAFVGVPHSILTLQAMAYLLATAWFLVEAFLIPEGLLKWFYLSFYIHPLILVLCQILIWVRLLVSWMRHVLVVMIGFVHFMMGLLVSVLPGGAVDGPEGEVFVDAYGDLSPGENSVASFGSNDLSMLRVMVVVLSKVIIEEEKSGVAVTGMVIGTDEEDEDANSVCSSWVTRSPVEAADAKNIEGDLFYGDMHMTMVELDDTVPVSCSWLTPMPSAAHDPVATRIEQDPFYQKYEQTMAWFDLLNHERACGISAISQVKSEETTSRLFSIWDERAKKQLIQSLESDLELAYVAQTCLSWEIMCYQKKKVEDLSSNSSSNRVSIQFNHIVVKELQKFRVLVQRFTEDERLLSRCRYREYVQARAACKSLLQVPEIPEGRGGGGGGGGEDAVELNEVMKSMEKCIRAFHGFVKADDKNKEEIGNSGSSSCSWWRLSLFLESCLNLGWSWSWSSHPHPVEDPRDLPLFFNLNSILLQKSRRLRHIRRMKKWWVRKLMERRSSTRTNPSEDQPQRDEETSSLPSLFYTEETWKAQARVEGEQRGMAGQEGGPMGRHFFSRWAFDGPGWQGFCLPFLLVRSTMNRT